MTWDKEIIAVFVAGLNRKEASGYSLQCYPDEKNRRGKAVDALYRDLARGTIAIEHTCLEPFKGAIAYEEGPFREVWEPLKRFPLANYHIWLRVPLTAVSKGQDWRRVGSVVKDWFLREQENFPLREAVCELPGLQAGSHVTVWKQYIKGFPGMVSIATYEEAFQGSKPAFSARVDKAVREKLPKLTETKADRHVLLLELLDRSLGNLWEVAKVMDELRSNFLSLENVEVWATDDSHSGIPGTPSFGLLSDGKVRECFLSRSVTPVIAPPP